MKNFIIVMILMLIIIINFNLEAANTAYYVDAENGSDSNSGTSESNAWKSLSKVNSMTFSEGDQILFKAGCSWEGQLYPKGTGSSSNPIMIDMYDLGNKPIIAANGTELSTLYFQNQEYWEINNLEITNQDLTPGVYGDYRGIHVEGCDYGTINHFYIKNCYIHDVTGVVYWIGGNTDNNVPPYILFAQGWDASKRTGGIVFEISSTVTAPVRTNFNDVLVEDCVIKDCSFGGIIMKQLDGEVGWGIRNSASDTNWFPHTNVTVRGNYLSQYGTDYGCNTIYLCDVQHAVIEDNLCAGAGTCAIETYYADDIMIQNNETYDTIKKAGGADSNGIDPDRATTNIIIQKNYVHDNGDGILLCQIGFGGDCVVRYNILQNNKKYSMNLHSSSGASAYIYNNVIYSDGNSTDSHFHLVGTSGDSSYLDSRGNYILRNNIFYSETSVPVIESGMRTSFDHNCYYGIPGLSSDSYAVTDDPLFEDPGTGGAGESEPINNSLVGYKLLENSSCINTGKKISDNGEEDFFGNTLYNGCPDIGVHEFSDINYPDCPDDETLTHYEAEDMILTNYSLEGNSAASGGYCVKASETGTAETIFYGASGVYDLKVWYFDENDGNASFVVYLNGEDIAAWTANQDFGSASPDENTLTSYTINNVTLNKGDTITITGTAEHYDYARLDLLECLTNTGFAKEAEDMILSNYTLDAVAVASGGLCIKTTDTGTAETTFEGSRGTYDIKVWYFDENDGDASFVVYLNSEVIAEWTANKDFGSASPDESTLTSYTISNILLSDGDTITIEGTAEHYDYARVDLLECIKMSFALYEAEEMELTNYAVESNAASSGGLCIKALGTGAAQTTFHGSSGIYDLKVWYFDENDGDASFVVYINGRVVAIWTADKNLDSDAPDLTSLTTYTIKSIALSEGDTITIEGTAEHYDYARVDMLELITNIGFSKEAEDMILIDYIVDPNVAASSGLCINTTGTGTAETTFDGSSGIYDLKVWYFDENDGEASFVAYVNEEVVAIWTADQDLGSDAADESTLTSYLIRNVYLSEGDTITIEGTAEHYDYARVDLLECINISFSQYEAEYMTLSDYTLESNVAASSNYCIKTSGTGTAQANFHGIRGTYDLKVWYFDENDGEASFVVYVNGRVVAEWTADQDLGSNAADESTLTSYMISNILLSEGDTITIEGIAEGDDYARVDLLECINISFSQYEAENMELDNYVLQANAASSGGYCVRIPSNSSTPGTVQITFDGVKGKYDLKVWYFDENDGLASYVVYVNDEVVAEWIADKDLGSDAPDLTSLTTYTISNISLNEGDRITIEGTAENYDYARVDLLECINISFSQYEAEYMTLFNYELEANVAASSGYCIKASGIGTAKTTFNGSRGIYDLKVRYFDENDGVAWFVVYVNRRVVAIWGAYKDLGSDAPDESTLTTHTIRNVHLREGDRITILGVAQGGDYARIDMLDCINKCGRHRGWRHRHWHYRGWHHKRYHP